MKLIAKSDGETLLEHSILVYEYGMKVVENLALEEEEIKRLKELLVLPLLFHDVGKGALGFQEALEKSTSWKGSRHEILSTSFLSQFNLIDEQQFAVITHHKDIESTNKKRKLPWEQIETIDGDTGILANMKESFNNNEIEIKEFCKEMFSIINYDGDFTCKLKEGIGIDDKWLRFPNKRKFKRKIDADRRILAAKLRGILRTADHLASAHVKPTNPIVMSEYDITKYKLRKFQEKCSTTKGSIMLTAPTGSGKTEATLLWARNNQFKNAKLYYILPYQASINAMYLRLAEVFEQEKIGLLHGNAMYYLYNIMDSEEKEGKKLDYQKKIKNLAGLAREIYHPVKVCTPHQLLRLSLLGSGWEMLFLELHNSVLIYDEIHAYQPRLVGMTLATAKYATKLGAKVAFASATLPNFLKDLIREKIGNLTEIAPESKHISDRKILDQKRHIINICEGSLMDKLCDIKGEIRKGKKVLIISNHVKTAQSLYKELEDFLPLLLHSKFNKRDRRANEAKLFDEKPSLVIATQVIEVSVDIDYEVMFTEPAPIDSLAQRFGRVNRKGQRPPEDIFVMNKQVAKHELYSKLRVEKTLASLATVDNPVSEMQLTNIVDQVYKDGYDEKETREFNNGFSIIDTEDISENILPGVSQDWVDELFEENDKCDAIPTCLLSEYENAKDSGYWIEANELIVSVNFRDVNRNAKTGNIFIVNFRYDKKIGLVTSVQEDVFM
ncbi:CRISPR-associated helicase Cas3' [bacterium AH-315-E09]|nr:CRISPR-associated helicase Cas3' [bacterium AH-315-E09]